MAILRSKNNKDFGTVLCLSCKTVLQSTHVHDYQQCECNNETMVDGGRDYMRVGGVDMDLVLILTGPGLNRKGEK